MSLLTLSPMIRGNISRLVLTCRLSTSTTLRKNYEIEDRPDDPSIIIPKYQEKLGESLKIQKARLIYQSRKRGMLENGLLLSTFADKYLNGFDEKQTKLYDQLINQPSNDWDIFGWATETKDTPHEYDNEVMNMLKNHVKNYAKLVSLNFQAKDRKIVFIEYFV